MVDGHLTDDRLPQKRTNVRLRPVPIPFWFRLGFQALGLVSPGRATSIAHRLFFTPRPFPAHEEENIVLSRGDPIVLDTRFGTVAGRSWGSGPTVLLIHGWSGRSGQMTAFVEPLVEAGFRVVALDLPAHGESEGRMSSLVHFAAAITAAAHLCGPFHGVVAHSLGTSGVILAFSQGIHAERVVFFAPASRFDSIWERFRTGLGVRRAVWTRMIAKAERWLDVAFETVAPAVLAPRMHAPLLVIHDVGDREIAFEEGKELVELWPDATMRRTEGMGHARILKDPASVQAAVQFLVR